MAETAERLLQRAGDWMRAASPAPADHPEPEPYARYLDWLADGAPNACPEPTVAAHVAACGECYAMTELLLVANAPAHAPVPALRIRLTLKRGLSAAEWLNNAGRRIRQSLEGPGTAAYMLFRRAPMNVHEDRIPYQAAPSPDSAADAAPSPDDSLEIQAERTPQGLTLELRMDREFMATLILADSERNEESVDGKVRFEGVPDGEWDVEVF